jgi:GTP cyclohydrolase I
MGNEKDKISNNQLGQLRDLYAGIISSIGEDVERGGLIKTPERAAKAFQFLTHGYDQNATNILEGALFEEDYNEMVIVKDIELYSLCEHHLLPFFSFLLIVELISLLCHLQ